MAITFNYPPQASASANASVGANGVTSPASSTLVAGQNPTGLQQPLKTDASGALITTPAAGSVAHVIVDSSALPTGASTSALQSTGNTSLSNIDTKTPALGQALAAASVPVVLPAAQITALTPPTTVTVTQATGTNLHTVIDGTVAVSGPLTDTQLRATAVPVSGSVTVSGAVTANIGTTNGLALDASLTTLNTSVNTLLKPASTLAAVTTVGTVSAVTAITNALPTGSNIIGALVANQSINNAQISGVATAVGAGPSNTGTQRFNVANVASATTANITSSTTSSTALASSTSRLGAAFYNDSTSVAYLKFGATASSTSFTVLLTAGAYYELPTPHIYSGIIDVVWATANGALRVTSW